MVTSLSLWSHIGYIKVRFQKTLIFPTDFNDFIKLVGEVWVALGPLLVYEGDFGSTLKSLWGHFGHIDVEWHV